MSSVRGFSLLLPFLFLAACTPLDEEPTSISSVPAASSSITSESTQPVIVVAENLRIPWDITFLPNGDLLVTERPGTLLRIGDDQLRHTIDGVRHRGEGGLLGIAVHPDFDDNHWIYLYLTTTTDVGARNRVERYRLENDQLSDRTDILTDIPAAVNHDGGALAFGPDNLLYITTGDAQNEPLAQQRDSLAGKILRVRDDGSIPGDNPFGNPVYSYGHRNPQGITWDDDGQLWATEHGRSIPLSGYDELNRIDRGANYGWPTIQGDGTAENMLPPMLHSGSNNTWAPASAAYLDGSIFFGGLRGQALYEAVLSDSGTPELRTHFYNTYGRIRAVVVGPDGFLYISTSNTDGRGSKRSGDDKILRIDPESL